MQRDNRTQRRKINLKMSMFTVSTNLLGVISERERASWAARLPCSTLTEQLINKDMKRLLMRYKIVNKDSVGPTKRSPWSNLSAA
jgi:hypothetical protein